MNSNGIRSFGRGPSRPRPARAALLGLLALACLAGSAHAQNTDWPNEYAKRVRATENISPLTDEAFGDKVNLFNGTVRFSHELISLPGNSALPVRLGIVYDPHDITQGQLSSPWDLDIPYVGAVHHSKTSETTGWVPIPASADNGHVTFERSMFWSGNRLSVGDGGGDLLRITADPKRVKPNNSVTYTFATKDGWYFSELPSVQNGPGKGLVGYAPNGDKYTFDWLAYRRYSSITHPWGYNVPNAILGRYKLQLYVTKVEDRFGNWVKYDWEYDHPKRIYANDGREIVMTYSDPVPGMFPGHLRTQILSATANGRTWTFASVAGYGGNVTNPDGTQWKFDGPATFNAFRLDVAEYLLNPDTNQTYLKKNLPCSPGAIIKDTTSRIRITHPSGAAAVYVFKGMRHGRTNVPFWCETGLDEQHSERNRFSTFHDTWSLIEKRIDAPGVPEKVYSYGYDGLGEGYEPQDESRWDIGPGWNAKYAPPAPNYKTVTVTEPDGTQNIHTFGRDRDINEGQLFKVETRKNGVVYRVVNNTYVDNAEAAGMPFPEWMGSSGDDFADRLPNSNRPLKNVVTQQDGASFNRSINAFDALVRPTNVTKWSSGSANDGSRTDTTEYHDDLALWVLGQARKQTNANTGWVVAQTDYDALARPSQRYAFGRLLESYGYNADGTLATITDGGGNVTTLGNWKRGIPQSIQYADQSADSAVVDDNGWLGSITDENGYTTAYAYDPMGRLQTVAPPAGDSNAWSSTQISFSRRDVDEYGLPPGHWMQTTVVGGRTCKNVFLDGFWRPVLTHEWDCADIPGTLRASVQRYDDKGRPIFSSYPVGYAEAFPNVFTTPLKGTHTDYEPLGRVSLVQQDSELGRLGTRTEHLAGFRTRVTNPRQFQTVAAYQTFDEPSTDAPIAIVHPEGARTNIWRDILGAVTAIRRSSEDGATQVTRNYVYDSQHRLCKSVEPETGATAIGYDAANNIAWSAAGLPLPAADHCNAAEAQASGRAVQRGYDARNRIKTLAFPDGRGNQSWEYWPDGLPKQIVTLNGDGSGAVTNRYEYNKRRLLTRERLSFDAIDWAFGVGYTNEGQVASHTYPNGQQVAYDTNGLGQPRRAGAYAGEVSYFANGGMARFVYGNGIVHTLQQNARGLAERSRDIGAATVLDDSYDYDANGNVAAISDGRSGAPGNRSMSYDGLDRLTATASSMFGNAAYSYDAVDNLRSVGIGGTATVPGRQHVYQYDGANRLELVRNAAGEGVIGLGYDLQGNLQNKNGKPFDFDYGNRLRGVGDAEFYRYDGHGRRVLSTSPTLGHIASMYGLDGVLRYQRDYRKEKDIAYFSLNGSLVAKASADIAPDVPVLKAPSYVSQTSYIVEWSATTAAGNYELQERAGTGAWQNLYSGNQRSRNVSGNANGSYGYRVRACNATGCGEWSAEAIVQVQRAPTAAPLLEAPATALNGAYAVNWNATGGATDYVLEESFNNGAWSTAYTGAGLSQSFSAKPYGYFAYRVKACNPAGCGPTSAASTVYVLYPPGSAPTLSAPAQSDAGSFSVSWNAIGGATRYELEQNALGGGWALIQDAAATSRTVAGGSTGVYAYRVRACNQAGCGATSAEASVQVYGPPTAAPSITLDAVSNTGTFPVSWTSVSIGTPTGYQLEESREGAAWTLVYDEPVLGKTVSGRGDGRYGYRVRGCNAAGCGPYAEARFITVDLPPATPGLTLADWLINTMRGKPSVSTCTVRWTTSAKTTAYELQNADTGALLYRGTSNDIRSSSSGQYCAYNYIVRACGSGGCSAWSTPPYPATRRIVPMD